MQVHIELVLGQLNFAFVNLLNLNVGLVLAYTFVLPQYLGQVQGYNTVQIGMVLIWGAVVNPFVPKLVEHLEARLVLAIGLGIFVTSCFMNSALTYYNGIRVVAGTLGSALLGTLLTKREQFHSSHIVEAVSAYNTQTQDRLQQLSQAFISKLGDPSAAQTKASAVLSQTVRQQANIMAFSDCFYFIGISLILVGTIVFLLQRTNKPGEFRH